MGTTEVLFSKVFEDCKDLLRLELLNPAVELDRPVRRSDLSRPGLRLTGFDAGFKGDQIQVLSEIEILYLESLTGEDRIRSFRSVLREDVPCLVVADGGRLPDPLIETATASRVPVVSTPISATEVVQDLNSYLVVELAAETGINGTLVDVYSIGILLRGKSGIGKSECALDLVERGHRLVADDLVRVISKPPGILIGRSTEPLQSYMEVRGVGLVDIGSIFGIKALRRQKRIEVEVNLREWEKGRSYDRSGLEYGRTDIMGVRIPSIVVPLVPGKSVSVIVEVIALSHILRSYGYDAAKTLDERWIDRLRGQASRAFEPRDME
ncbi:MAG: HPr(Ser) kinase/phosphatase [Candidatus Eisenbacteria bacterium]